VFLFHKNFPDASGTGQTCLLRPMVAKGFRSKKVLYEYCKSIKIMEILSKENIKPKTERPKHKGGAPSKRVKREQDIRVRLTATERFHIESKSKAAGMRISDWFRTAAKMARVVPRLNPEDRSILHMLAGMANNLNQLTKLAHVGGILSLAKKCNELLNEIDEAIKYFNKDDRQNTETGKKL
jgi:hypothetical protein